MIRCVFVYIGVALFSLIASAEGLRDSMYVAASGMRVQGERMKVVAQNIANAESAGGQPGQDPYRRQIISFKNYYDDAKGVQLVKVNKIAKDYGSKFEKRFDPAHPAANEEGYVTYPNVKKSIENIDMREAQRSYEANLGVMETTKRMYLGTIDLLR